MSMVENVQDMYGKCLGCIFLLGEVQYPSQVKVG